LTDAVIIRLDGPDDRDRSCDMVRIAPKGHVVTIRPAKRSLDQSAKFHAICADLAKSELEWPPDGHGKRRAADEWKFLLVSAHAVATKVPGELMLGLEGERVMLRPSTAAMSVAEMTSLIEYCLAFAAQRGIPLRETTP
jgi:hypothetical protein